MTTSQLHNLSKYARYGSWAIWNDDPKQEADTQVILDNVAELRADVVIVGLNVSAQITKDWGNFRGGKFDRRLRYAFNHSPYRGAYMTDLFKGHVQKSSAKLLNEVVSRPAAVKKNIELFKQEMKDVGASGHSLYILLGGLVTDVFRNRLAAQ